ncbi:MAG TPA: hypothetical protein VN455_10430, partial [Methanotrichaceae archaeon]|nr:hypothetical protein [Methanotrichaceae archaeon]
MNRLWLLLALMLISSAGGRTLVVDPSGSGDSKTIGGAVHLAGPGDEIIVKPGSYQGGLEINRSLNITAQGTVTLEGPGRNALTVTGSGCRISNI